MPPVLAVLMLAFHCSLAGEEVLRQQTVLVNKNAGAAGPKLLAHMCGTYPNRYLHMGLCPDNADTGGGGVRSRPDAACSKGGQLLGIRCSSDYQCGVFRDFDTECDAGQCCSIPDRQTLYWETCENGGYFMSGPCLRDSDCVGNTRSDSRWANENQVCLQSECCTVPTTDPTDLTTGIDPSDIDANYGRLDNRDQNWNYLCANGGYYLDTVCQRDGDCNRISTLQLQRTEQIACIDGYCCIMPRRLPPGARDWLDVCPSGGNYLGTFCDADKDCGVDRRGAIGRICEQNRYCCTNPRGLGGLGGRLPLPSNNLCDDGDTNTGAGCSDDSDCGGEGDEYCGNGFCCIVAGAAGPQVSSGLLCSNGGRKLGLYCQRSLDCGASRSIQQGVCINGECCTMPGLLPTTGAGIGMDPNWPSGNGGWPPGTNSIVDEYGSISTYAYCYNAQRSRVQCTSQARCLPDQSCINELCCTTTGDEWLNACGGSKAISSCFNGGDCQASLLCTSSNYCCECEYGQTAGRCTRGCPPGYACEANGYCCPKCVNEERPYGSCYNNLCATGFVCRPGNICCSILQIG